MMRPIEDSQIDRNDDEIDLRIVFQILWSRKLLIGAITSGFATVAIVVALLIPNQYRAEAILAPTINESSGSLGALAAQYGGLASLAGINLSDNSSDKTTFGLEVLKSRRFLSEFITRHDALIPLMAAKGWDRNSGDIIIDEDRYDSQSEKWVRKARPPRKSRPSAQEAYEKFTGIFSITQDDRTGYITISVENYSPIVARNWIAWMIEDINETIRQQDVTRAEQAIEYLEAQIAKTSLAGLHSVFFNLIEEQTKTIMLASISREYLFTTVDPPIVAEEKSSPRRALLVLVLAMLGGLVGAVVALIRGGR